MNDQSVFPVTSTLFNQRQSFVKSNVDRLLSVFGGVDVGTLKLLSPSLVICGVSSAANHIMSTRLLLHAVPVHYTSALGTGFLDNSVGMSVEH